MEDRKSFFFLYVLQKKNPSTRDGPRESRVVRLIAQEFVDARLGTGLRVDLLDDHRTVCGGVVVVSCRLLPRYHDRVRWDFKAASSVEPLPALTIPHGGTLAEEDPHAEHRPFPHDHTFDHLGTRADEAAVFDDGWIGLEWLKHTTDTDTAREVNILADLCAGTHGGPRVDHGAFSDVGANVHVGRHQDHSLGNIAAVACHRRRYHANTE